MTETIKESIKATNTFNQQTIEIVNEAKSKAESILKTLKMVKAR